MHIYLCDKSLGNLQVNLDALLVHFALASKSTHNWLTDPPVSLSAGHRIVQPYRVDSTDGQATVECLYAYPPRPQPQELHVTLLKGLHDDKEVCSGYINSTIRSMRTHKPNVCQVSSESFYTFPHHPLHTKQLSTLNGTQLEFLTTPFALNNLVP